MAEDRWAHLAVAAAASGMLDFSKSRRYDINWRIKENWILAQTYRLAVLEVVKIRNTTLSARLADSQMSVGVFNELSNELIETHDHIYRLCMPWSISTDDARSNFRNMVDMWKEQFGDPDDPEVRKKISETVAYLLRK